MNVCWGIDIGSSAVKAVKLSRTKTGVEITGLDLIELEVKAQESEEAKRDEQVREALTILKSRNKFKNEPIWVSIPGQGTYNRTISLPPVEKKRIKEIVKYEAQQQIPFPIEEVIWDYHPIGGEEETGAELEVSLFAVKREIINNFMATMRACDLNVEGIQIAPIALYNFVRYDVNPQEPTVVIDIGADNSDLVVVDGERLWMRSLQIAGSEITKELQKKFQIPFEEAEKLKIKAKKSKQAKKIFNIIRPILKDMVNEVHRSVGYYKSLAKSVKFEKMLFLGNSTKLMGFKRFFSQNLQYQVDVFAGIQRIHVSNKVNVNLLNQNVTTFGVAIGLALQGQGLAVNNIRLIPQEIRKKQEVVKKKPWFAGVAVVFGLMVAAVGVMNFLRLSSAEALPTAKKAGSDNPIAWYEKQQGELAKAKAFTHLEAQKDLISIFGRQREVWPAFLAKFRKLVPDTNDMDLENKRETEKIWLLEVRLDRVVYSQWEPTAAPRAQPGKPAPTPVAEPSVLERYQPAYEGVIILAVTKKDENGADREGEPVLAARIKPVLRKSEPKPHDPQDKALIFFRQIAFQDPLECKVLLPPYAKLASELGKSPEEIAAIYRAELSELDRLVWSGEGKPDTLQFTGVAGQPYFPTQSGLSNPEASGAVRGLDGGGGGDANKYMLMKVGLQYLYPYKDTYTLVLQKSGQQANDVLGELRQLPVVAGGFVKSYTTPEKDEMELVLVARAADAQGENEGTSIAREEFLAKISESPSVQALAYQEKESSTRRLVFTK
ncbi:MAG: type IV pilus assembly protein PilM [Planctomycetes bacterium]|nr:type IV pilus assembly protein PilM [Planctomycetota bacterium]